MLTSAILKRLALFSQSSKMCRTKIERALEKQWSHFWLLRTKLALKFFKVTAQQLKPTKYLGAKLKPRPQIALTSANICTCTCVYPKKCYSFLLCPTLLGFTVVVCTYVPQISKTWQWKGGGVFWKISYLEHDCTLQSKWPSKDS
jgi:hypothetical protein